jgi:hypothetical protein
MSCISVNDMVVCDHKTGKLCFHQNFLMEPLCRTQSATSPLLRTQSVTNQPSNQSNTWSRVLHKKLCDMFCNSVKWLWWGVVSISPNPQAGGSPLLSCAQLLIQYICSYLPNLEDVPPSVTWERAMLWWQGPLMMETECHSLGNSRIDI